MGFLLKKDRSPFEQKASAFLLPEIGHQTSQQNCGVSDQFLGNEEV